VKIKHLILILFIIIAISATLYISFFDNEVERLPKQYTLDRVIIPWSATEAKPAFRLKTKKVSVDRIEIWNILKKHGINVYDVDPDRILFDYADSSKCEGAMNELNFWINKDAR
jgi:hypothetical protein